VQQQTGSGKFVEENLTIAPGIEISAAAAEQDFGHELQIIQCAIIRRNNDDSVKQRL